MSEEEKTVTPELDAISQTIKAYDQVSGDYVETWFNDPVMGPSLDRFLSYLEKPSCVLDIGCGPGRDVSAMMKMNVEAVGVDLSSAMIAEARARVPNAIFRQMDQRHLTYPPETFDGIWSCAALHHLPKKDIAGALKEFARVLKHEGILCAIVKQGAGESFDQIGRYQSFYTAPEFRELVKAAGFEIINESTSYSDKGTLGKNPKNWFEVLARRTFNRSDHLSDHFDSDCLLCSSSRFKLNRRAEISSCGSILWGDNDFYVMPDIAPLMEGHLLLVSTQHSVCYGACPDQMMPVIRSNQRKIRQLFQNAYGQTAMFLEHGPVRPREAGACISHAHFHCLPTSLPIKEGIARCVGVGQEASLETLQNFYGAGQSYLYLEEDTEKGWAFPVSVLPSQLIRQVTVLLLGREDWEWQSSYKTAETREFFNHTLKHLLPFTDVLNLQE